MTPSVRRAVPVRTCVATNRRFPSAELLRVVVDPADSSRVCVDAKHRLPGRGAWIQPTLAALDLAEKRRAIPRALRVSTTVDTSPVRHFLLNYQGQLPAGAGKQNDENGNDRLQRKTEP